MKTKFTKEKKKIVILYSYDASYRYYEGFHLLLNAKGILGARQFLFVDVVMLSGTPCLIFYNNVDQGPNFTSMFYHCRRSFRNFVEALTQTCPTQSTKI
jgi:hypothetical protein